MYEFWQPHVRDDGRDDICENARIKNFFFLENSTENLNSTKKLSSKYKTWVVEKSALHLIITLQLFQRVKF